MRFATPGPEGLKFTKGTQGVSLFMPPTAAPHSARIQRAAHREPAPVEHVGVHLRRAHVAVPQQLLLRTQAVSLTRRCLPNLVEQPRLAGCLHGSVSSVNHCSVCATCVLDIQWVANGVEDYTAILSCYNTPHLWQKLSYV
jgi:hypothetical protein